MNRYEYQVRNRFTGDIGGFTIARGEFILARDFGRLVTVRLTELAESLGCDVYDLEVQWHLID